MSSEANLKDQRDVNKDVKPSQQQQQQHEQHQCEDITNEVCCFINYSGPKHYKACAQQIEEFLKQKFPGLCCSCVRLPEKENMVDIRIRKGTGGDEFLHYIENIPDDQLDQVLLQELPLIQNKIYQQLLELGWNLNYKAEEVQKMQQQNLQPQSIGAQTK